jgi:hypothetical protein
VLAQRLLRAGTVALRNGAHDGAVVAKNCLGLARGGQVQAPQPVDVA